jgi:6-phosphogluconolactonase/glucosamine-6-phosphate isomerase/deaminase
MVHVNNSASNYGMIKAFLLEKLPRKNRPKIIPQMERFDCSNHEKFLQNTNLLMDEIPHLSQAFLGLGADGHIASLFPERRSAFIDHDFYYYTEKQGESFQRMTLSIDFLRQMPEITFLVSGKSKHSALKSLMNPQSVKQQSPALQLIKNYPGKVNILSDQPSCSGKVCA